jgi:hypothetical protein
MPFNSGVKCSKNETIVGFLRVVFLDLALAGLL